MAAVNVDSDELADVVRRLRRAQGQIGGVIRMIEEGQECSDVLTQLAAAARALDRAGFKVIASGLCQCVLDEQAGRGEAAAERARLEELFLGLGLAAVPCVWGRSCSRAGLRGFLGGGWFRYPPRDLTGGGRRLDTGGRRPRTFKR